MRLGLLSAAWLAGVLLGLSAGLDPAGALLLAGAAALTAIGLRLARMPTFPAVLAVVLLLGLGRASLDAPSYGASHLQGQRVVAIGTIASDPETTARRVRFELQIHQAQVNGAEIPDVDERWLVYVRPPDNLVSRRNAPFFRYGDGVTVQGTPSQPQPIDGFDYPSYLAAQGITATLFATEGSVIADGGSSWRSAIYFIRGRLAESIERSMPYPESALATTMLLGKRESLPPDLVEKFRGTGAAHLLAISGLHVGVLLAATAGAAAWLLGRQRPTYLILAAAVIWLYVLAAGASPSALRAAVMGTVYLAALGIGRPSSALPALALAAAAMTAVSPGLVRQVSFQLSFAAVGGIALALAMFGGRLNWGSSTPAEWGRRLLGWSSTLAVISAAATLATWPLAAANFGQVALLGVPVSLLTIPAMAPLIATAMVAATAGMVLPPLGELLGWIAVAPTAYLIAVISAFPSWTMEADWVGRPLLLAWYGGLGLALLAAQPRRTLRLRQAVRSATKRVTAMFTGSSPQSPAGEERAGTRWPLPNPYFTVAAAVALGIAAAILWLRVVDGPDGYLHVHFLDIGQGDSTLIVTPSGRRALIDGGPDGDGVSQALAGAMPGGDRSLDLVVMTHLDSDHSQGLLEVLDRHTVGAVLSGPQPRGNEMQAQWEQRLQQYDIAPVEVRAGHVIELGEGVELAIINPPRDRLFNDFNNDSVALRLSYGNVSFLLTADIESEAEHQLADNGAQLQSTVLKVAHHGSNTSTTPRFLDAVNPTIAVVSAGLDNRYGHPASEVMERLEAQAGTENVYRTDLQGNVEVVSDGGSLWVRSER